RPSSSLPEHLHFCLQEQKHAVLAALRNIQSISEKDEKTPNTDTKRDLESLLNATVQRGEGNSCLVIGPRGSGKTKIVEDVIASLPGRPIIVRLSGYVQRTDRLALREIARQVAKQTEQAFGAELEDDVEEEQNPFDDATAPGPPPLPPSHLPTLISSLPTLGRPTVLVLDAFDLFAEHGRQALLYCLLDTAQSCRAGTDTKGIAIVGVTARVDTLNMLEKRVKSRFSGRMLRTSGPGSNARWQRIARIAFLAPPLHQVDGAKEWKQLWTGAIERFLADKKVEERLSEVFELVRDVRLLCLVLTGLIAALSPKNPYPTAAGLLAGAADQCALPPFPFLNALPYPALCLLIAAMHERTAGNDAVTFEMLHDAFQIQVRTSTAAPVQNRYGGSIGMAFERLVDARIFVPATSTSGGSARQFVRHRCMVEYEHVKRAVEASVRTDLKRWLKMAS
ncbi:origin recognition complex subunit 4 C-terminus-domain-containing protein, partial [Vararia minispora EC-137]